jgi:hypothetical protein
MHGTENLKFNTAFATQLKGEEFQAGCLKNLTTDKTQELRLHAKTDVGKWY